MSTIEHLVDDVCIYNEKCKKAKEKELKYDLNMIPLRAVPLRKDFEKEIYKKVDGIKISILNERGNKNSTFGWCFVCRKPADKYCKDTTIPLCSVDCKDKHIEELSKALI